MQRRGARFHAGFGSRHGQRPPQRDDAVRTEMHVLLVAGVAVGVDSGPNAATDSGGAGAAAVELSYAPCAWHSHDSLHLKRQLNGIRA